MNIDFEKTQGLVPVIIQDVQTLEVLMLGYIESFTQNAKPGRP